MNGRSVVIVRHVTELLNVWWENPDQYEILKTILANLVGIFH